MSGNHSFFIKSFIHKTFYSKKKKERRKLYKSKSGNGFGPDTYSVMGKYSLTADY